MFPKTAILPQFIAIFSGVRGPPPPLSLMPFLRSWVLFAEAVLSALILAYGLLRQDIIAKAHIRNSKEAAPGSPLGDAIPMTPTLLPTSPPPQQDGPNWDNVPPAASPKPQFARSKSMHERVHKAMHPHAAAAAAEKKSCPCCSPFQGNWIPGVPDPFIAEVPGAAPPPPPSPDPEPPVPASSSRKWHNRARARFKKTTDHQRVHRHFGMRSPIVVRSAPTVYSTRNHGRDSDDDDDDEAPLPVRIHTPTPTRAATPTPDSDYRSEV